MSQPPTSPENASPPIDIWELATLVLSIFVLVVVGVQMALPIPAELDRLLAWIDTAVCLFFLADFVRCLRAAPDKAAYLKWGWIDLLASLPMLETLRWGRVLRLLFILRMLRTMRRTHRLLYQLLAHRFQSGVATVAITTFLVISASSIAVLVFENGENANIKTAEDAVWWSVTTITTVGYGDKFPFSTEGRVVAMALMFCGVGLFGVLSGLVASIFLGPPPTAAPAPATTPDPKADDLRAEIARLKSEIDRLNQNKEKSPGVE